MVSKRLQISNRRANSSATVYFKLYIVSRSEPVKRDIVVVLIALKNLGPEQKSTSQALYIGDNVLHLLL